MPPDVSLPDLVQPENLDTIWDATTMDRNVARRGCMGHAISGLLGTTARNVEVQKKEREGKIFRYS